MAELYVVATPIGNLQDLSPRGEETLRQADLIIATGGQGLVRQAYASGTPAFGVGAGNAQIYVDDTALLDDAASKIIASKTFDMAIGCSCDNSVIVHESVYDDFKESLKKVGGYILPAGEKDPFLAVADEIRDAADLGGDDRHAEQHRLTDGIRGILHDRRAHEHVALQIPFLHLQVQVPQ